ncbi:MAG: acyltransferase [Planctomycetes bacterium]|nr:acyltransferase [Planctomycetota bacterium]
MADASAEPGRIACLDGIRGLALIVILPCHCALPALAVAPPTWLDALYLRFVTLGFVGLDIFFVLSGFLITGILVRTKGRPGYFRNFYMRRSLRVFPLYYLVVGLLLFVLPRPEREPGMAAAHLLYYQNVWYALSPMHVRDAALEVTWSMAIEEQFYLVWPALIWLLPDRHHAKLCLAAILGGMALRYGLAFGDFERAWLLTPCRADAIGLGALLAVTSGGPVWFWRLALFGSIAGLLAIMQLCGPQLEGKVMLTVGLSCAGLFAASLIMVSRHGGWLGRVFSTRFMGRLGLYSYAVYLTHVLLIEYLAQWTLADDAIVPLRSWYMAIGSNLFAAVSFYLLAMAVGCGVGWLSWHLIEKRFLALKRHFPSA